MGEGRNYITTLDVALPVCVFSCVCVCLFICLFVFAVCNSSILGTTVLGMFHSFNFNLDTEEQSDV